MNIEEQIKILKEFRKYNKFYKEENKDLTITITLEAKEIIDKAIETLLTAYEKEKKTSHYIQSQLDIANAKLVEEKEKNKKIIIFLKKDIRDCKNEAIQTKGDESNIGKLSGAKRRHIASMSGRENEAKRILNFIENKEE